MTAHGPHQPIELILIVPVDIEAYPLLVALSFVVLVNMYVYIYVFLGQF